jgi:imidazole glycerol phosphate synthase glutamine amidotransferase subunit
MVDLISCAGGNLGSVRLCLDRLGIRWRTVEAPRDLSGSPLLLPGVGSFGAVSSSLRATGLLEALRRACSAGTPALCICSGMQVLFPASPESPGASGLGLVGGEVRRFDARKVPQVGWNRISPVAADLPGGYAYFVNSYYCLPDRKDLWVYRSDYAGTEFCAGLRTGGLTALQFHPEKSGELGHRLVEGWYRNAV